MARCLLTYALRVASWWNVALHLVFARRIKNTIRSWNAAMILLNDQFGAWLLSYDYCVAERHAGNILEQASVAFGSGQWLGERRLWLYIFCLLFVLCC